MMKYERDECKDMKACFIILVRKQYLGMVVHWISISSELTESSLPLIQTKLYQPNLDFNP